MQAVSFFINRRKEKEKSEEKACRAAQKKEIGASGARIKFFQNIRQN